MSKFRDYVYEVVQKVPYGKVVSYGQVALYAGIPRAARQVGWILNQSGGKVDLPWWRVVNNAGRITIKGARYSDANLQRKLLVNEGLEVDEEFNLDIEKYRFRPSEDFFKSLKHDELYLGLIARKIPFSKPLKQHS
jgi:methylated-DNA-protein-cysteine methyltransferase-like protein